MADGRIALVGGAKVVSPERDERCDFDDVCSLAEAEIVDPQLMTSTSIASLRVARQGHLAMAAGDGLVVFGGFMSGGGCIRNVAATEIWDGARDAWRAGPPLYCGLGVSAAALTDGRFLVSGGMNESISAATRVWDPVCEDWSDTANLHQARYLHASVRLADGRVLVAGGLGEGEKLAALGSTEVFDPVAGAWAASGSLTEARAEHTLMLLSDGSVLAIGGYGDREGLIGSVERWDPERERWSQVRSPRAPSCGHSATLLADGRVFVAGGLESFDSRAPSLRRVEVFDPERGTFELAASLVTARSGHSAFLSDAGLLLLGGYDEAGPICSSERWSCAIR